MIKASLSCDGRRLVGILLILVLVAAACADGGRPDEAPAGAERSPQTSARGSGATSTPDGGSEESSRVPLNPGWKQVSGWSQQRFHALVAATDQELLVWGGNSDVNIHGREPGYVEQWDGVLIDPVAGEARDLPTTPLCDHGQSQAVWTGNELVVWNEAQSTLPESCPRAASLSLAAGTWQVIDDTRFFEAVGDGPVLWSGREILAWEQGLAFDPATEQMREFPPMPEFASFTGQGMSSPPTAHWAADRILIQGSRNIIEYDPAARQWREGPRPPIDGRALSSVWTGTDLLAVNYSMEAALFDPSRGTWEQIDEMPLRFYECVPDPVAADGVAFVRMCSGIAAWDGSGHWTLFPLTSPVIQPGQHVATNGSLYHVGEMLLRYELPPKVAGRFERFPDFFPVNLHYLDVPDGWRVSGSDGTTYASRTNADLAVDVTGPDGQQCQVSGHHGQLTSRHGDPARITRARDGETIEVTEKKETASDPAQVFLSHPYNTTDAVTVTCPSLPDARLLAANLWAPPLER